MTAPKILKIVQQGSVLRHPRFPRAFLSLSSSSKMANESGQKPFPHFGTLAIHAGQEPEQWNSRAVVPPISMATTFKQDSPGVHRVSFNIRSISSVVIDVLFICYVCDFSDLYASFRDLSTLDLEIQLEIVLKLVLRLWRVENMVR